MFVLYILSNLLPFYLLHLLLGKKQKIEKRQVHAIPLMQESDVNKDFSAELNQTDIFSTLLFFKCCNQLRHLLYFNKFLEGSSRISVLAGHEGVNTINTLFANERNTMPVFDYDIIKKVLKNGNYVDIQRWFHQYMLPVCFYGEAFAASLLNSENSTRLEYLDSWLESSHQYRTTGSEFQSIVAKINTCLGVNECVVEIIVFSPIDNKVITSTIPAGTVIINENELIDIYTEMIIQVYRDLAVIIGEVDQLFEWKEYVSYRKSSLVTRIKQLLHGNDGDVALAVKLGVRITTFKTATR